MATISLSQTSTNIKRSNYNSVVEEINGLIRVHKDGHVERPPIVPHVSCMVPSELDVVARDVIINKFTNLGARVYAPNNRQFSSKLPLLVYFHGGGFCVGSASWACYHDFLTNVARVACCAVLSVNYRLAPEKRLPAAYDDGVNAIMWLKQEALKGTINELTWCDISNLYLAGDSAGGNIAYHVASRLVSSRPVLLPKGIILIQPFFGGESRTTSEKHSVQPVYSALTLSASDTYWRLTLPLGFKRDHPYCNPLARGAPKPSDMRIFKTMICVAELDILKDRNLEFAAVLANAGSRVQSVIHKDVGHAFQVLQNYPMARTRTNEMITQLKAFINP